MRISEKHKRIYRNETTSSETEWQTLCSSNRHSDWIIKRIFGALPEQCCLPKFNTDGIYPPRILDKYLSFFSVSTPSHLWWLIGCCSILQTFHLIRFKWHILWSNTFSHRQNEATCLKIKRENNEVDIFWCDTETLFRCEKDQMNIIWRYKDNCRISCGASPLQSIRCLFAIFYFATECLFSTA